MSRITNNVPSLIAQRVLGQNNNQLNTSLERLSTGFRINRGKDDPAGLIASQNLRAEKASIGAAIRNAERADQVVNIAEGGLGEISGLLTELQGLVTTTANSSGLSQEEKEANQLQIDSILQTIDRVAGSTSFQGTKLLNGTFDYEVSSVASDVSSFKVNGAKIGYGDTLDVEVVVTQSAQVGGFFLSFGAGNLNLGGTGASDGADDSFVIEITGAEGSRELSFASGTSLTAMVDTINSFSDVTGVTARVSGTTGIRLESNERGSDEFVSIRVVDDGTIGTASNIGVYNFNSGNANASETTVASTFANATNKITDSGQDIAATINGINATTKGTVARINTDFLDVEVDLEYNTSASGGSAATLGALSAFTIDGGGAEFQLGGNVDIASKVGLGISNVAVRELGRTDDNGTARFLSDLASGQGLNVVDGDLTEAQKVVSAAINEVSSLRGRLGAFQANTIGATVRSLGVALENTTAAESVIRDTDFASETASLTRSQILASSAQNTLATANFQPQNVLSLLG